jgi:hypothetical protein
VYSWICLKLSLVIYIEVYNWQYAFSGRGKNL